MNVPQCNPAAAYQARRTEIDAAIRRVLDSGYYILGQEVAAFEAEFAAFHGIGHCVSCANGTDAIELALRALGIGPGDTVLTVANTAVATVSAIGRTGAAVAFADIEPDFFTIDPAAVEKVLRERSIRAVVAVHLFGQMADLPALRRITAAAGVALIEDCAQAHGAKLHGMLAGTQGEAGAFSFYPTKNLGAIGDGGAVLTASPQLAERLRELRQYGWRERYVSEIPGLNSRLDELQAAILRAKLPDLASDNRRRAAIAAQYDGELAEIPGLVLPRVRPGAEHVYHQYVIRTPRRDALRHFLLGCGVGSAIHYPEPIHRQKAYRDPALRLPVTEAVNREILSLPMYPGLTSEEVAFSIGKVREFFQ